MSLMDKLRGELIDIIEWLQASDSEVLAYRFPRYDNEIKYGAKLIVREGQAACFVNEGQLADVFTPGTYTLETNNLPILATLKGWKYGFHSPFKAEVYFISTKRWTDLKWGTQNPIMMRDPEFGPVRVRAFGSYAMQITNPATFLRQLVATDPSFETYEITAQLRNVIVSRFTDAVGKAGIAVLDLAGNYDKISGVALQRIAPDLAEMGLTLVSFLIENISLPPEVEKALDERSKMGVLGDMSRFTQYQAAQAIPIAAGNPGGLGGLGAGIAAGAALGQQMAGAMGQAMGGSGTPPAVPGGGSFHVVVDGKQAGPFDIGTLASQAASGKLTRSSLVWRNGMANWVAAETVPELQGLFSNMPPTVPK